jgi:hypothetical protein
VIRDCVQKGGAQLLVAALVNEACNVFVARPSLSLVVVGFACLAGGYVLLARVVLRSLSGRVLAGKHV